MAEKCAHCEWKLKNFDEIVVCKKCGAQYHKDCINRISKCRKCGEITAFGQEREEAVKKSREMEDKLRQENDARRLAEEQNHWKAEQEKYQARINHLKTLGKDGYYEYKVVSMVDKMGMVNVEKLTDQLNDLGLDGWRLQCAYTNEMGKNALEIAGFGLNATADQNILIFERFVKFE